MKTLMLSAALLAAAVTPALAQDFSTNPATVKAGTYKLDPAHGKITWSLSHLGFSTYTGQFSDVNATLTLNPAEISKTTLTATVDIASIGTLNPKLDSELTGEKFFNAAKFPTATFVSTKIVRTGTKTASVYGNLTLLGVTKPEVLLVTFNQSGTSPIEKDYEVGFEGKAVIQRSQFGLSAYVPYVGDEVTLDLEGEFHLQP
jgi:polyisoprenoid-binding protein YceI